MQAGKRRTPTISTKLWLGFGTLTALLALSCGAILVRVRLIEKAVHEIATLAAPRATVARELEINVLGYALNVRAYLQSGDPVMRQNAHDEIDQIGRHLADYEQLATTQRQRDLANRFDHLWREFRDHSQAVLVAENRQPAFEDMTKFRTLRTQLESFLNDEIQADAIATHEAHRSGIQRDVRSIVGFTSLLLIAGVIVALMTSAAVGTGIVREERIVAEQAERLRITLASIGDAVITTDTAGRVTDLNAVAQSLTGWANDEAAGQPLDVVFRIINEKTRQPAENPALRSLREGVIVGLSNHTVLIHRDGTPRPIDDSAAPIRGQDGEVVGCVLVFRDVTEGRRAQQALHDSEQRFRTLFESMDEGYCVIQMIFDEQDNPIDYRFLEINPAFEKQTGIKSATGRLMREIAPDHEQHWFEIYGQIARTGETLRFENHAAALHRWYDVCAFRVGPPELRQVGIVFNDITLRRKAIEALRDADRKKDEFLAMLAHELRNPLAPIRHGIQILKMAQDMTGAPAQRALEIMERQTHHITRLVDDLLDVSRITRGKIALRNENVDLAAAVRHAIETARPVIDSHHHTLTVVLPQNHVEVAADPTRFEQVLVNLLNNAAKYTGPHGHISVTAEADNGCAVIRVRDTGVGMSPELLPKVFDLFTQGERTLDRSQGGLGIGLTLAKKIVEMHGGSITAHSEGLGKGSEFVVHLPAWTPSTPPAMPPGEPALHSRHGMRVLVVEDVDAVAQTLKMLLQMWRHDVRVVHDGPAALVAFRTFQPDVILLDIGLPGMDGYEVAKHVRGQQGEKRPVIIAITGYGGEEHRKRSLESGCNDHMTKPVDANRLKAALAAWDCATATACH